MDQVKKFANNPRVRRVAADVLARIAKELSLMLAPDNPGKAR